MAEPDPGPQLLLVLDGFEGPMDLLLDLARRQKVDLAKISILSLVEQYLAIVEDARRIRLELAADWLVMAAWLTWLKSRLLLPPDTADAEEAGEAADVLAARLAQLEHVQRVARWLAERPQLGIDVFPRGTPERLVAIDSSGLSADLPGLIRGYMTAARRGGARRGYQPKPLALWTVADAMARLERLLGHAGRSGDWSVLSGFMPHVTGDPVQRRAAVASTLLAGLELARGGIVDLKQDEPFGDIFVRGANHGS